jgi:hypothetical protein
VFALPVLIHRLSAPLKQMLPGFIWRVIHGVSTAVLTPLLFSFDTGHARSALRGRAVDRRGTPLPWYTYPTIDLLRAKDLSGCRVLEFGAGQSTIWWATRAREVVALEDDPRWCTELARWLPGNVSLRLTEPTAAGMAHALCGEAPFDITVVDGLNRLEAARLSLGLLAEEGAILLDNSEGYWGPPPSYPIIDLFRNAGFRRVDFYGYAPGVVLPHCTSLFFCGECRLLRGAEPPVRYKR